MVRPLRLTAFGARRAASWRQSRAPARDSSPPRRSRQARRRAEGAILPGATILKPGKAKSWRLFREDGQVRIMTV